MMKIKRRITKGYFDLACRKYKPLVKKLSFMIGVDAIHIEELQARANDEILKCLICYDGRGSFITLLYTRIKGLFRHMRDSENRFRRIKNATQEVMECVRGKDSDMNSIMILQECLECLNKKELDVITDLYFNNKTLREIAAEKGNAASTVYRIKIKAIEKMQQQQIMGVG